MFVRDVLRHYSQKMTNCMLTLIGINFSSSVTPSDTGARKLTFQTQFKLQLKLFRSLTERIS